MCPIVFQKKVCGTQRAAWSGPGLHFQAPLLFLTLPHPSVQSGTQPPWQLSYTQLAHWANLCVHTVEEF